jgi:hypothetical protein
MAGTRRRWCGAANRRFFDATVLGVETWVGVSQGPSEAWPLYAIKLGNLMQSGYDQPSPPFCLELLRDEQIRF